MASKMRRCSGCDFVRYCSTTCQKKHWRSQHRHECADIVFDRALVKDPNTEFDAMYSMISSYQFHLWQYLATKE